MRAGLLAARRTNAVGLRAMAGLLSLATLILLAATVHPASAQESPPEVEVEIVPASVELSPEGEVQVLVVARNPSARELGGVRLSWFSEAAVDVAVDGPGSHVLVPFGTLSWTLRLSSSNQGSIAGTVHLRIDYAWKGEAGEVPCVRLGSIPVKARAPEATEQVAEVRVETTLESLSEHRPGIVYLVVTNTSDEPIRVVGTSASIPAFLTYTLPNLSAGVTLSPREARALPVEFRATEAVQPGKHLLVLEAVLEWEKAGRLRSGNAIATHEIEVGILGESEILTAVGVPSFLILPGFLMVVTVRLLWEKVAPRTDFWLEAKSPEFWLVAITLSVLAALVYPIVTGWRGVPHDYLLGYGLGDVVWVWFGSVVFAAVVYFLAAGLAGAGGRIVRAYRARDVQQRTPSTDDTPVAVLGKLHRQGLGILRERANVVIRGEAQRAFLLQPWEEGREKIWVGPSIVVEWLEGADAELRQGISDQLEPDGDVEALAALLEEGERTGALEVRWNRRGRLAGPREVDTAGVELLHPAAIIQGE